MALKLLENNRFWILAIGIIVSINIAGFIQFLIPSGSLQIIRMEQWFGFISITLLYFAVLASPLTNAYPSIPFKDEYLHARRAIGVLSFYYAALHAYLTFFNQLGGVEGVQYYSSIYMASMILGFISFGVLAIMTMTSLDWAVRVMGFKNWKLLHRLVYVGSIAVLVHVVLIGSHYDTIGLTTTVTVVGVLFLLWLELRRMYYSFKKKVASPV